MSIWQNDPELADSKLTDMHHLMILRHGRRSVNAIFRRIRAESGMSRIPCAKVLPEWQSDFWRREGKVSLDEDIHRIFEGHVGLLQKILRPEITVEDLLTMQSGVDFNEMGAISGNDWVSGFLDAPVRGTPGTTFEYNSMNSYMLSATVTERRECP